MKACSGIPLPPLEGTVRLKADNFTFAGFSLNPFQATASLSPNGIRDRNTTRRRVRYRYRRQEWTLLMERLGLICRFL